MIGAWPRRRRARLGPALIGILALLACAPARVSREVATFQRALDEELAHALVPRAGPGLAAPCHRAPIVWMHFLEDGRRWRLMSVDQRGEVGIWTESGLAGTWSLRGEELAWVRRVSLRQDRSEDAAWLRARARALPAGCRGLCARIFSDIAPRDGGRWVGVSAAADLGVRRGIGGRRVAASGRWAAVGDAAGSLVVRRIAGRRGASTWIAPGCDEPGSLTAPSSAASRRASGS